MHKIKSHIFRGKRYRINWNKVPKSVEKEMKTAAIAFCDGHPSVKRKSITIDPRTSGRELLRAAVDEGIHACIWDLDNNSVDEIAESVSRFLWRIGYRDSSEGKDEHFG